MNMSSVSDCGTLIDLNAFLDYFFSVFMGSYTRFNFQMPYSQHFIVFLTYEWVLQVIALHYTWLERHMNKKYPSLFLN